MFRKFTRKRVALALTAVAAMALAAGAYAYFTANGAGDGSATVGQADNITLAGTITGTLYPAGDPASVSVLVTNPGSGSQKVGSVHLASISTDAAHSTCDLSVSGANAAFSMADISVNADLTKSGTAGDHTTVGGSLQMNDTNVSQNNCQGAPLTLHFTSN
jgi:FlaG/FlaF family flagellin (archaellin)